MTQEFQIHHDGNRYSTRFFVFPGGELQGPDPTLLPFSIVQRLHGGEKRLVWV
jgi:hypothetical protein